MASKKTKRTIIIYMPVVHVGYVSFIETYASRVLLLDRELLLEILPRMKRDIRAFEPNNVKAMLEVVIDKKINVTLLTGKNIAQELSENLYYLPDEDISHEFANTYIANPDKQVEFISTFLRWDKVISKAETIVPPDRTISTGTAEKELMKQAARQSVKSPDWWRQVGAVLVKDGEVQISSYNAPYPTAHNVLEVFGDPRSNFDYGKNIDLTLCIHAEAKLIAQAAKIGLATAGADMYVTTFPCPTCAKLIADAGIKRLYYQAGYSRLDAEDIFRANNIEIILVKT